MERSACPAEGRESGRECFSRTPGAYNGTSLGCCLSRGSQVTPSGSPSVSATESGGLAMRTTKPWYRASKDAPARAFGLPICRLGLASHGETAITPEDVSYALGRGLNFLNWPGLAEGPSDGDAFRALPLPRSVLRGNQSSSASNSVRGTCPKPRTNWRSRGAPNRLHRLTLYYVERQNEWDELISPGGVVSYLQGHLRRPSGRDTDQWHRRLRCQIARTNRWHLVRRRRC
jgi:hypothetical protein